MSKMLIATNRQVTHAVETFVYPPSSSSSSTEAVCVELKKHFPALGDYSEPAYISSEDDLLSSIEKGDLDPIVRALMMYRWKIMLQVFGMEPMERFEPVVEEAPVATVEADKPPVIKRVSFKLPSDIDDESKNSGPPEEPWDPFSACAGLVQTAFKQRGPMTAGQGEAIREFFRGQARS